MSSARIISPCRELEYMRIGNEKRALRIVAECLHRSACNRRSVRRTLKRVSTSESPLSSFSPNYRSGYSERARNADRQR